VKMIEEGAQLRWIPIRQSAQGHGRALGPIVRRYGGANNWLVVANQTVRTNARLYRLSWRRLRKVMDSGLWYINSLD